MGEATVESSDDEGGPDEEVSAEDKKNHEALIKRVENAHSQKPGQHAGVAHSVSTLEVPSKSLAQKHDANKTSAAAAPNATKTATK